MNFFVIALFAAVLSLSNAGIFNNLRYSNIFLKDQIRSDEYTTTPDGENFRRGEYSYVSPDGSVYLVTYTAGLQGYRAKVSKVDRFPPPKPAIDTVNYGGYYGGGGQVTEKPAIPYCALQSLCNGGGGG